ncbi:Fur family transcriptional regulator [Aestuariivirga sp.]|uniref:Fur family transcriptional regulator n=1 Tax=Aestuariivirga sp. TaxID=2650926 RepID=UPI003BAA6535
MLSIKTPATPAALSRNEEQVYDALRNAARSMSAYEILAALRDTRIKAAVQVYRALGQLIAKNRVHRIESLNAFVVCRCEAHSTPAGFYICDRCGSTCEFDPGPALGALRPADGGFEIQLASIELRGLCTHCASTGEKSS